MGRAGARGPNKGIWKSPAGQPQLSAPTFLVQTFCPFSIPLFVPYGCHLLISAGLGSSHQLHLPWQKSRRISEFSDPMIETRMLGHTVHPLTFWTYCESEDGVIPKLAHVRMV